MVQYPKEPLNYSNRALYDLVPDKGLRQFVNHSIKTIEYRNDIGWFTEFYITHNLIGIDGMYNGVT